MPFFSLFFAAALAANVAKVQQHYDTVEAPRLVPMLSEVLRFPTYEHNDEAHADQKKWLMKTAADLGFTATDAGKITEITLPAGKKAAPVLGLVVHGDVQPVDADAWTFPPFNGIAANGYVYGRGSADDKGPLVQALLAMKALKESGVKRTHTIRLLVGSTEESDTAEVGEYLQTHKAPDYSLVLDSGFPVIVGEKAWDGLFLTTTLDARPGRELPYAAVDISAGLSYSIVPDRAEVLLQWTGSGEPDWKPLLDQLAAFAMPAGTRFVTAPDVEKLRIVVYGKSAHAGVNLEGGRNALVALARLLEGRLPAGGVDDILAFARLAGQDLYGTGLGITDSDPVWGRYSVNVATVKLDKDDPKKRMLAINLRRIPPRTAPQIKEYLQKFVTGFNTRTGSSFAFDGYYQDEPLGFDPNGKLVKRLLDAYQRATGTREKPAISGGGTYAKRLPNSIAFGMWFPDKPYPGHDVDEKNPIADLQRGTHVLIEALTDLATGARVAEPFKP
ncbi:MAG TPA: Sapep family Mn(2+)-dependent dipeptidase [Thermoanaerobaculia bacterium]|jgi:succinyl-diaminopimelate desuccinylase|nr:Sapep family Mn(2+)-dependent dipeptidase [Thermoanaerobaculia bacterium]